MRQEDSTNSTNSTYRNARPPSVESDTRSHLIDVAIDARGGIQDKDRFNVVLTNPPFGGKERKEVQQNLPIRTGETAFLFLQHFIKK